MTAITIEGVRKTFPNGVEAVAGVDLEIGDGEFLVLVGPSGCGKTTLLRMLAGLEETSAGRILLHGRDVTDVPPQERDIAMVFQNYALYPHMTVAQNLAFGLKLRKVSSRERDRRVAEVAKTLGLDALLTRKPQALSGGQRQRVAMGRAIIRDPQAFLMDEPLSNLDAKLRVSMRAELGRLHSRLNVTTVYVTHDQIEAMTLGQRVAVMRDGRIQQVDKPQVLYSAPENLFVAAFIGSPAINLVEARVEDGAVFFGGFEIPLSANRQPPVGLDGAVILGIRPESFESATFARPGLPTIDIDVDVIEELGSETHVFFTIDAPKISTEELQAAASGDDGTLLAEERARFSARVDSDSKAQIGRSLKLAVDTQSIHFFDVVNGRNLLLATDSASLPA
jgi:multiple sugar transport system ATP-binding protein